jgi:hypothetical protein
MREESALEMTRAIYCEKTFVYSCFLELVLNVETKHNTLRIVHGLHLNCVTLSHCHSIRDSCVDFSGDADLKTRCAEDDVRISDDDEALTCWFEILR